MKQENQNALTSHLYYSYDEFDDSRTTYNNEDKLIALKNILFVIIV